MKGQPYALARRSPDHESLVHLLLHTLGGRLDASEPFHIISGYRSPHTNSMLRARGGTSSGVASGSLHVVG